MLHRTNAAAVRTFNSHIIFLRCLGREEGWLGSKKNIRSMSMIQSSSTRDRMTRKTLFSALLWLLLLALLLGTLVNVVDRVLSRTQQKAARNMQAMSHDG